MTSIRAYTTRIWGRQPTIVPRAARHPLGAAQVALQIQCQRTLRSGTRGPPTEPLEPLPFETTSGNLLQRSDVSKEEQPSLEARSTTEELPTADNTAQTSANSSPPPPAASPPIDKSKASTTQDTPDDDSPPINQTASPTDKTRNAVLSVATHQKEELSRSATRIHSRLTEQILPEISSMLNTATGYSVVQDCKNRVLAKDAELNSARERSDHAKNLYERNIEDRRKCQKELNSLLQRKDSWLDADITRFTELYRRDLSLEQAEGAAKKDYDAAVENFERCHREYLNEIRERYIEEQLYSDKIRRASTWWTWGLISVHFTLFLVIQLFVEPRKRANLERDVMTFIRDTSEKDKAAFQHQMRDELAPIVTAVNAIQDIPSSNSIVTTPQPAPAHQHETRSKSVSAAKKYWLSMDNSFWQGLGIGAAAAGVVAFLVNGR
ncbi:sensitivity to high expression protein she9 [Rhizophlyctis rosea]|uniref:Sensitive to high expression protein 9, mitochondrial n=1 Tax=Rhizophlyctis rosea TaxID=64517 RepID=A0AAD5SIL0_9FUNG|nr:sensitivity to high expression protein she9 [Rhizophlyctis rosea]